MNTEETFRSMLLVVAGIIVVLIGIRSAYIGRECDNLRERVRDLERRADQTDTTIHDIGQSYDALMDEIQTLAPVLDSIIKQLDDLNAALTQEEDPDADAAINTEPLVYAYEGILNPAAGVNYYNGQRETYYNLPMTGVCYYAELNGIEGEYWEREDGCKMWGDYIICAAAQDRYGQLIESSLGTCIALDTGSFALVNPSQIDIAVTW